MLAVWDGWTVVAGVGGVVAGFATLALVIVTWMLVDRTQRMATAAQRQLLAGSDPLLVDVEHNSFRSGETEYKLELEDGSDLSLDESWVGVFAAHEASVVVSAPLRNVGSGVAVISAAQLLVGDSRFDGVVKRRFIAPGEVGRFEWQWSRSHADAPLIRGAIRSGQLRFAVNYTDFAAQRATAVTVELREHSSGVFRVFGVEHDVRDLIDGLDRPAWALALESFSLGPFGARIQFSRRNQTRDPR